MNSSYETQIRVLSEQLSACKDDLMKVSLSETLCSRTKYPTQLLSSLASDPLVGLLPENDIGILIRSLMWFYKVNVNSPILQEKSRNWASVQLQAMTRMPQEFLRQHTYLNSATIPQCFIKVISIIESNIDIIVKRSNPSDLLNILCRIGLMTLKQKCLPTNTMESILTIFQKSKQMDSVSEQPLVSKFFDLLSKSIRQGGVHLSSAATKFLLSYHKESVKLEVINLLTHASAVNSIYDVAVIQDFVTNSPLVLVSSTRPAVFQHALSIMVAVWLNSEGHPGLGFLMAHYVAATGRCCKDLHLVSLFPDNVQHLALLFSLPSSAFSSKKGSVNIQEVIDAAVRALSFGICTPDDLSALMVIYPSVYHQFLLASAQESNSAALGLLKILWKISGNKTDEELLAMARLSCHNVWLCQDIDC